MRACLKPARRAPTRISIFSARPYTLDVFQLTLLPYSWLRPPNVKRSRRLSHDDRCLRMFESLIISGFGERERES